jgi:tripartite-type tricarboxylate transporter receptor subunit TctC
METHMMITRRSTLQALAAAGAAVAAGRALAEDERATVTILVGAASSMDVTARLVAQQLHDPLGRPVIVLSKLGAGGRVALGELKRAAPDGRTLMFSTSSPFAIYPNIYTQLDYDPVRDFTPIAGLCTFDVGVATGPATGVTDIHQLVDWVRKQGSGGVEYGSAPGAGSASHFCGIAMSLATGLRLNPVQYKDSGVGIIDLAAGRLPIMITGTSPLVEMHQAGKIRLLAVSGDKRTPLAPEIPTLRESGIDVFIQNSAGLYAPAGMGNPSVDRLRNAMLPMLDDPDMREKLLAQGMTPAPMTGVQLAASLAADRRHFAELVKASGYVPEAL